MQNFDVHSTQAGLFASKHWPAQLLKVHCAEFPKQSLHGGESFVTMFTQLLMQAGPAGFDPSSGLAMIALMHRSFQVAPGTSSSVFKTQLAMVVGIVFLTPPLQSVTSLALQAPPAARPSCTSAAPQASLPKLRASSPAGAWADAEAAAPSPTIAAGSRVALRPSSGAGACTKFTHCLRTAAEIPSTSSETSARCLCFGIICKGRDSAPAAGTGAAKNTVDA
mmetsp:Transcript_65793/g.132132  ORF Transcript_65793/g.132132 Transcript_65793/m.132132 type:complete len:222 (-) Transcript_65793:51-716(-)